MRIVADIKHIIPMAVLFMCGCTSPHFEAWDKSVFSPSYWNLSASKQQVNEIQQQIKQALARENIELAQQGLLDSRRENISEHLLLDLYTEVTNRLLQSARQSSATGQSDKAGEFFRLAREVYPVDTRLQATISLSLDEIDACIEQCADQLMHNGLVAYRAGELDSAINIWKRISRFHPNHPPSLVAANTAKQQLKRLELISAKNAL